MTARRLTWAEWKAVHPDYRYIDDGGRGILTFDRATGATVLERVIVDYTHTPRKEVR